MMKCVGIPLKGKVKYTQRTGRVVSLVPRHDLSGTARTDCPRQTTLNARFEGSPTWQSQRGRVWEVICLVPSMVLVQDVRRP